MGKPNILLSFSDQQRSDTLGCYGQRLDVSPCLDRLAANGVLFENAFTPQPVCGPCRSIFQSGRWPTETGCFRNNIALPMHIKTLARYFTEQGYDVPYIGKWHLASSGGFEQDPEENFRTVAIPLARRGGYNGFWRASDALEFTSHGYDGFVFDESMNRIDFTGYRTDCITDFALEYLDHPVAHKPFFMTVSHLEPHHQNDRNHYEGPRGSKERFRDFDLPGDLAALPGDAKEEYPDYLGASRSLDDNLARLVARLDERGLLANTVIVYVSDHGSHFRTRNHDAHTNGYDDYKRSCHSACLRVPLVISGPGFRGGRRVAELVSTAGLAKTLLSIAGISAPELIGEDLTALARGEKSERKDVIFAQISESRVGRCVRTRDWLYAVYAPGIDGGDQAQSDVYADDFLYDLKADPYELNNLVPDARYDAVRVQMRRLLAEEMVCAGEKAPVFTSN